MASLLRKAGSVVVKGSWASWVERFCLTLFAAMTVIVLVQVFFRYILHNSLAWPEDLARYLMIWIAMVGAAVVAREDTHYHIEFIVDNLPRIPYVVVNLVCKAAVLLFLLFLLIYGFSTAMSQHDVISPSLGTPMVWPYMAIPVGALLLIVNVALTLYEQVRKAGTRWGTPRKGSG
ncbi:MAG: TRAP transporter small permease [Nitrospinota bacterium]